jgi:hypothetical protein
MVLLSFRHQSCAVLLMWRVTGESHQTSGANLSLWCVSVSTSDWSSHLCPGSTCGWLRSLGELRDYYCQVLVRPGRLKNACPTMPISLSSDECIHCVHVGAHGTMSSSLPKAEGVYTVEFTAFMTLSVLSRDPSTSKETDVIPAADMIKKED